MKPQRAIYDAAILSAGEAAEAIFFTDDREENVTSVSLLELTPRFFEVRKA